MIDITKAYKTKSGQEVRIYATDGGGEYPIHGAVKCDTGWDNLTWKTDGTFDKSKKDSRFDLIEVKPKIKMCLNVYPDRKANFPDVADHQTKIVHAYPTRGMADTYSMLGRIACIEIEFEEGQGI